MTEHGDGFEHVFYENEENSPPLVQDYFEHDEEDLGYHEAYVLYELDTEKKSNRYSIASMVLGIIGFLTSCAFLIAFPVLSLIFGSISLKQKRDGRNMAITGVAFSIATVILYIVFFVWIFRLTEM